MDDIVPIKTRNVCSFHNAIKFQLIFGPSDCEASTSAGCKPASIPGMLGMFQIVQAVTIHATNNYFVAASLDNMWCFYELASGLCLTQVEDTSGSSEGYTATAYHPDGLILGTGTPGVVKIWDVKSQANVAKFDGHIGALTAISFSDNNYFLAWSLTTVEITLL